MELLPVPRRVKWAYLAPILLGMLFLICVLFALCRHLWQSVAFAVGSATVLVYRLSRRVFQPAHYVFMNGKISISLSDADVEPRRGGGNCEVCKPQHRQARF